MATVAQLYQVAQGSDVDPGKLIQWLLNPTFNQGSFNGTFGTLTPSPATFTSVVITTGGLTILGGGLSVVGSTSFSAIDSTPIGATTPSTGAFTSLKVAGLTGVIYSNGASGFAVATNAQLPTMTATVGGAVPTPPNNTTTFLRGDGTFAVPAGSSGTVTTVSVATSNGFAGTVANATTTPAITLTTSVTGILKGNGTAISAAVNSDLPTMTATVGGAVPTPPNNTTTFLRGDGTFATPSGGGGGASVANQPIINGGFVINQRGYVSAATLAAGSYGHDRWKGGASGGDYSFTQLNSNTTITIAANKTLIQVIEDKHVQSATYVLSWTGTALARYAVNSATPSGSYAASPISISGQTPGTTMSVEFGNGASVGTLGNVMLTPGASAGTYDARLYAAEWELCQRYCPSWSLGAKGVYGMSQAYSTTAAFAVVPYQVTPRVAPTGITTTTASGFNLISASGSNIALTAIAIDSNTASIEGLSLQLTVASGLVGGNIAFFNGGVGATKILATGCEL